MLPLRLAALAPGVISTRKRTLPRPPSTWRPSRHTHARAAMQGDGDARADWDARRVLRAALPVCACGQRSACRSCGNVSKSVGGRTILSHFNATRPPHPATATAASADAEPFKLIRPKLACAAVRHCTATHNLKSSCLLSPNFSCGGTGGIRGWRTRFEEQPQGGVRGNRRHTGHTTGRRPIRPPAKPFLHGDNMQAFASTVIGPQWQAADMRPLHSSALNRLEEQ
eukprot:365787-Chlamydomonas_euryale.AAC.6